MRLYTLYEVTKCDIVTFFVDGASQDFWNVKNVLWHEKLSTTTAISYSTAMLLMQQGCGWKWNSPG